MTKAPILLIILAAGLAGGCGNGADTLHLVGICTAYPDDETSPFVLPFAPGGDAVKVTQANCSSITHYGPQRYAYDFDVAANTPLYAARAGTVIDVKTGIPDGGDSAYDAETCQGNAVRIQHSDESVSHYFHMSAADDGVQVKLGDAVTQGQAIGKSGSSGCTGGYPHLHFVVWADDQLDFGVGVDSMPVVFRNVSPRSPNGLKSYTSYDVLEVPLRDE